LAGFRRPADYSETKKASAIPCRMTDAFVPYVF
jgi:hypothetical protein